MTIKSKIFPLSIGRIHSRALNTLAPAAIAAIALSAAVSASAAVSFTGSKVTQTGVGDDGSGMTGVDIAALGTVDWAMWTNAGSPAQSKAGGTAISSLTEVGSPLTTTSWKFTSFVWDSGGDPTASQSAPGFAAGLSSEGNTPVGEGYSIGITLPTEKGTINFWGVTRFGVNELTIVDSGLSQVYSDSYSIGVGRWDVTTFTMDWTNATVGETVTLNWLRAAGGTSSVRTGLAGIAVVPEPSSAALLLGLGALALLARRRR